MASLLAVWLSGAVFLFCCEMPKAKASETESCPLKKASHCDKKADGEIVSPSASLAAENHTIDCCRFPAQVFDKARKLETQQQAAKAPAIVKVPSPEFAVFKIKPHTPNFYQSVVRNRGSTFLRNCVFRI